MTRSEDRPKASKEALQKLVVASKSAAPGSARQHKITVVMVVTALQLSEEQIATDGLRLLHSLGDNEDPVVWSWVNMELSERCYRLGKMEEARRLLTVAMKVTRANAMSRSLLPKRLSVCSRRALVEGDSTGAWELMVEAYEIALDLWGPTDARVASRMVGLGKLSVQRGALMESIGWFEGAIAALTVAEEPSKNLRREAANLLLLQLLTLVEKAVRLERRPDAKALAERGVAIAGPVLGTDHTLIRQLQRSL